MDKNTTIQVLGRKSYKCHRCGKKHTVHITGIDLKNGFAEDFCHEKGMPNNVNIRQENLVSNRVEKLVLANGLNRNYPDGFAGID